MLKFIYIDFRPDINSFNGNILIVKLKVLVSIWYQVQYLGMSSYFSRISLFNYARLLCELDMLKCLFTGK